MPINKETKPNQTQPNVYSLTNAFKRFQYYSSMRFGLVLNNPGRLICPLNKKPKLIVLLLTHIVCLCHHSVVRSYVAFIYSMFFDLSFWVSPLSILKSNQSILQEGQPSYLFLRQDVCCKTRFREVFLFWGTLFLLFLSSVFACGRFASSISYYL